MTAVTKTKQIVRDRILFVLFMGSCDEERLVTPACFVF